MGKRKKKRGFVLDGSLCDNGCGKKANHELRNGKKVCKESGKCHGQRNGRLSLVLEDVLCGYGCGRKAYFQFKNGKFCCSSNQARCPSIRKKISQEIPWNKGLTTETDLRVMKVGRKISKAMETASWNRGLTKEIDSRIALLSERMKGDTNPMKCPETAKKISDIKKGFEFSEESRNSMSKTKKELGLIKGNKNPNWQGGIGQEPYCQIWGDKEYKEDIKTRDNYECQNPDCRNNNNGLVLHHINYDKKDCGPFNLTTLCKSCNSRANFDRGFWEVLYRSIVEKKMRKAA